MDKSYFEACKKILKTHKFPIESDQQVLEIINNIEDLAKIFLSFQKGSIKQPELQKPNNKSKKDKL